MKICLSIGPGLAYYIERSLMKIKELLWIVFICFILNSCSRLDVAMRFASTYVVSKTDDYFELNREQNKWFREKFEQDFYQVKKIIFPQLAAELIKASDVISSKRAIDANMLSLSYERVKSLFYEGLRMFSANIALFAEQLLPYQIVNFQKEFDKKLRSLKENDSSKEAYSRMKKQFGSWMGALTSIQNDELEKFTIENPPFTHEKIYNRQFLANEFYTAYPIKTNRAQFVLKLTTRFSEVYESKFSKLNIARTNKLFAVVSSILNKMNENQRETLVETLRDRAHQLASISKN